MDIIIKLPIILLLVLIIGALARSMYYLSRDDGNSSKVKVAESLTIRIVLSFVLFTLLIVGYLTGIIQPHGV